MRLPEERQEKLIEHAGAQPVHEVFHQLADRIDPFARAEGSPPRSLVPFLKWSLRGTERQMLIALVASVSVGVSTILGFWLISWLIDSAQAFGPGFLATEWWRFAIVAVFYLIVWPATLVANAAFNSVALMPNLYALTLARINRHTLGQNLSYFDNDFAGRIAQKAQQTARAITDVVNELVNIMGNAVATVFGAAALFAFIDWRLSAIVLLWMVSYGVLINWYLPKIRARSQLRAARRAVVTGQIVDTITNIVTVKLFSHGKAEEKATERALSDYRQAGIEWAGTVVIFRAMIFTLAGLLPVLLIGLALVLWADGTATAGTIAAAGLVSTRLSNMTGWVSFAALGIFTNIGEVEDGIRTLTSPHRIIDAPDATDPTERAQGSVGFENITFAYGGSVSALDGFDLRIKPGEKVALVGQSGAGKSTAVALLLRLYDTEEGKVTLDGRDIRSLTQDGLRRQVAMVRQETAMFNRSARDNIAYGRADATDAEIEDAARRAEAHDFILKLRDHRGRTGYDAHLGERGVKLSGGQRQRIALARAILKDAPVLVLDEATSALDSEIEALIQRALERVMDGKTVIAIAHRLSTIATMDRIVVLEQGRIAEEGSHSELLSRGGLYARFWQRQSGGFIGTQEAAE
ncbi:MAG: ABC transporter ATP-binding protein [Pseudomonadota bacterium]